MPNLTDPQLLDQIRRMDIILVIGEDDPFIESNRQLSAALWDKGVWHGFHIWHGRAHSAPYWRRMVELYMCNFKY